MARGGAAAAEADIHVAGLMASFGALRLLRAGLRTERRALPDLVSAFPGAG